MTRQALLGVVISLIGITRIFGQEAGSVYKVKVRLVEVYATVFDHKGRHVPDLTSERFEVRDNGVPQSIQAFETSTSELSCAILLDATGSMEEALPVVKNALLKLIDGLRPDDWIAVYSFNTSLSVRQDFARDKAGAKRAVLRVRAGGGTALFDAVAQVAIDLSQRQGKKVIVAFTDGRDNASVLHASAAMTRARKVGVPLYTVAQGEAHKSDKLLDQLREMSKMTGRSVYVAKKSQDIEEIFADITKDPHHTYMLAYAPAPASDAKWRTIALLVKGLKEARVRARTGYFPN